MGSNSRSDRRPVGPDATDRHESVRLQVTERCARRDLRLDPDLPLWEMAAKHVAVAKFLQMRGSRPEGQEVVQGFPGPMTIWTMHVGRYRALTGDDREFGVVWLLVYGIHRTGDRSDLYSQAGALRDAGRLLPTQADYARLLRRRNATLIPDIVSRLRATLEQALLEPGVTQAVVLPYGVVVSLLIEQDTQHSGLLPRFEQRWIGIETERLQPGWLQIIQAVFASRLQKPVWNYTPEFPERGPTGRELRFRCRAELRE